jgi:2-dehydropantoate 2-reductase
MKILVMGSGGVGGYFGGRLTLGGEDVTFVARGDHLRALQTKGLTLRGPAENIQVSAHAVEVPAEAGLVDLVLFTVKSYDTESVANQIKPCLGPDTVVLTLQNGVSNAEKISEIVGKERVMAGAGYIVAGIESPGVIKHATAGRITFGELDGSDSARGRAIAAACEKSGIRGEFSLSIRKVLWEKFALICGQGMTASVRLGIGQIRACPESRQMLRMAYEEVTALAVASGIELQNGVVEWLMKVTDALPPDSRTSLAHDLSLGKRLEVEGLQGTVVRLGKRYDLPTPMNFAIYAHLKPYDRAPTRVIELGMEQK